MADQKLKVITPDNLGQGIVYNPASKQYEVHFVSEAEIEQVQGYAAPQEDDEHYVVREEIKLRERSSGFMWDSYREVLKNRAPAMDESATPAITYKRESGRWYIGYRDGIYSNIDGEIVSGEIRDPINLEQFNTTEELNNFVRDKKAQYVTRKRFSNILNDKPMIRSTVIEIPYPEMEDEVFYDTFSSDSALSNYINNSNGLVATAVQRAIDRGDITITGTVTYGEGEHRGETKTFKVPSEIISERPYIVFGNLQNQGIEGYSDKNHYTFTASPKTITLHDVGYTYHVTLNDFDDGVVIN